MTKFNLNAITFGAEYTDKDSQMDGYPQFENAIKARFESMVKAGVKLFRTDATNIYETYLAYLPAYARQHYTCNACEHFFNRFGSLVTIDDEGIVNSVLWDEYAVPAFFVNSVKAMRREVLTSKVTGVFLSDVKTLGIPKTGEWTHPHVCLPRESVHRSRIQNAGQAMADKQQEFGMVNRALRDFSMDTVDKALALVNSESLYRGDDKVKPTLEWFKGLIEKVEAVNNSVLRANVIWSAIASAPNGFAHIRGNTSGALLKDIAEGMPTSLIISRFGDRMSTHMRSQSAPSENAIYQAEKLVADLGIENSLMRRYAKREEVSTFWNPKAVAKVEPKQPNGRVFGHLLAQSKTAETMNLPTSVMTWDKFSRTVLPTADGIEVLVDNPNKFMALVTAVDETAENILQWDNPTSWYYHGGIDAEMKRRVEEAGGRYEDNEIRVSLMWEGLTDLDLHCVTPRGEELYYHHKKGRCGGFLDLDMNGIDKHSHTPVENVRWTSNAPEGRYKFFVHNYNEKVNYLEGTPFKVELEIDGQVYHYEGQPLTERGKVTVFEFNYVKGQQPVINGTQSSPSEAWNVQTNSFVKVNGITTSPNLWNAEPVTHAGTHIFFLLDGVKDLSEGKGRGFFNEMLKPELRQIRKTLELFTANTPIEDAEEATACGVGYSKDQEWNLTVKVTSGNSSRVIKIDRWD